MLSDMSTENMAGALNKNELTVLSAISKAPAYVSEIMLRTTLNRDTIFNCARRLMDRNLVRITADAKVVYSLTELGKKYLKTGLPEKMLIEYLGKKKSTEYAELAALNLNQGELSAAIGFLKKAGVIAVSNGKFSLIKNSANGIYTKDVVLSEIYKNGYSSAADRDIDDLIRRKIVEKVENVNEKIEITALGIAALKDNDTERTMVDKLTPDSIKNWKNLIFREYSLDTVPPIPISGRKHIVKKFVSDIQDAMVAMGFAEMKSDYAESGFWNFDVMMFRQDHPDRDIQDTVYIGGEKADVDKTLRSKVKEVYEHGFSNDKTDTSIGYGTEFDEEKSRVLIMRGHTTATTFRYIDKYISKNKETPAKYFSVSKVFRNETPDATHTPEFYQIEGIVYGDGLNVSHLIGYIKEFYRRIGIDKIRLKPTYNPYTEPSLEIQAFNTKLNRWVEVGNSGVFRPETLAPFGITKHIVAWGFGLDRMLALQMLGLRDIREIYAPFSDIDLLRNIESARLYGWLE